ncbi:MAG TPA: polysaccharide biosynthesis tyrosine autokinase, partial [Thermoanaerobaculia bacterium]|nr:polysaccharide biosynthesis tyrosine autokinase [Thermoanaerobaculia bacterium]
MAEGPAQPARLSEYWAIVVRHWRLILACVVAGGGVAALVSVLSTPTYKATVVISLEKERATPMEQNWRPDVPTATDPDFIPTQLRLMKSREVAERAVDKLKLSNNPALMARQGRFGIGKRPVASSPGVARRAAVQAVRAATDVTPIRGTNLVELSFIGRSPRLAAEIANGLADAYIGWNLEAKYELVGQASAFLKSQVEQLKSEIGSREQQLLAYGRQKDILSADPSASGPVQKLDAFNSDYAAAVADRVAKEARNREVQSARPETLIESSVVGQLRGDQARLEREYAEKLNLFKPEWPAMQQLKAQIDKNRQHMEALERESVAKVREVARGEYMTALRREQSLVGVLRSQKSEAQAMNVDAVQYNNLQTQIEAKKALLESLLRREAETQMLSRLFGERSSNVRIVDRALPPTARFTPSYKDNGLIGLLAGTFLGAGLAFFLARLDRSLRTAHQVEQSLRLPVLGVIPRAGTESRSYGSIYGLKQHRKKLEEEPSAIELIPHSHPRSRLAERYRALRTALLLSRAGGIQSIVITSSSSREGKTATAVNLAIVLAQLDKRVLLVDADLHRPRIHEVLRVSNRVGLVSVLAENQEPARAIVKTEIDNLSLMPSGPSSPNPSGLLSSDGMNRFLELARMNFDYVILDAPPVMPVADALLLGHQADGVVLCVKGGETPR